MDFNLPKLWMTDPKNPDYANSDLTLFPADFYEF